MVGSISSRVAASALILAGLAFASLSGAVASPSQPVQLAQTAAQAPPAKGAKGTVVTPVDRVEKRITQLHERLKITDAQAAQWNAVADVMRANAQTIDTLTRQRAAKAKTMTAVDDIRSFQQLTQANADGLQKLATAWDALYGAMSDDQKKNADAVFRSFGQRGRHGKRPAKQQG